MRSGHNPLFKCVSVTKVGQGHPKLLLMQRLHQTHQVAKYEVYIEL